MPPAPNSPKTCVSARRPQSGPNLSSGSIRIADHYQLGRCRPHGNRRALRTRSAGIRIIPPKLQLGLQHSRDPQDRHHREHPGGPRRKVRRHCSDVRRKLLTSANENGSGSGWLEQIPHRPKGGFVDTELAGACCDGSTGVDHQLEGLASELRSELPACVSPGEHSLF